MSISNSTQYTPSAIAARLPLVMCSVRVGERLWSINAVQNEDALVDSIDALEHLPYGFLLWESAVGLAEHLYSNPHLIRGKKVLELGCGVGLPGIVAHSLGAYVSQTDHQQGVLTLAQQNCEQNQVVGLTQFLEDWREWRHSDTYDVIIGADIMYERAMHYYIEHIFRHNLKPGGRLILSDPGRPQAVDLISKMESSGWQLKIDTRTVRLEHESANAKAVEVIITTGTLPGG